MSIAVAYDHEHDSVTFGMMEWVDLEPFLVPSLFGWDGVSCLSADNDDNEKMESLQLKSGQIS